MNPKGQTLAPLSKGPSRDPQPLEREILSLTHSSGFFLGISGRNTSHSQSQEEADFVGGLHLFHDPLSSPPHVVLCEQGVTSLAKAAARPLYPTKDLEISREIFYPENEGANLRPLIKTETTEGQGGRAPQVTIRTTPYPATELAKIQEKYTRQAQETETEYVWRVSLTGGDRILLSEDEAQGYWGPGVFLVTDDQREPWSLTQRAAYWAGGLDPLERGDPVCIETPTVNHLTESLQKAACLQLMYDRRLVPQQPSPMLLIANPDQMTPLIRGLPDSLKSHAVQLQDRLRNALAPRGGRRAGGEAMTWGEIAQDLINYGRRMGLTRGTGKPKPSMIRWFSNSVHPFLVRRASLVVPRPISSESLLSRSGPSLS
ncbi:uncharacterized protein LOC141917265 [Strix aluco]|uniref:uncharacterized protein LOC141917265 n=1 Tax=Strix aluco TaxID=111821 RepID=UPI003DA6648F